MPSFRGLLIDTNLLVLFTVGTVNRRRIESFKRTSKYNEDDYDLLVRVIERAGNPLYTVAHVLAEVSNLTDLTGRERRLARRLLRETITKLQEPSMPSERCKTLSTNVLASSTLQLLRWLAMPTVQCSPTIWTCIWLLAERLLKSIISRTCRHESGESDGGPSACVVQGFAEIAFSLLPNEDFRHAPVSPDDEGPG